MRPTVFLDSDHINKGFYALNACIGCEIRRRVCLRKSIIFLDQHPGWNHAYEGCNVCVVYCPAKAIQFKTPDAYLKLNNIITRRLSLPEKRARYHNSYITAAYFMNDSEDILSLRK